MTPSRPRPPSRIATRGGRPSDARALSDIARAAKAVWGYPADWLEAWRPALTLSRTDLARLTVRVAEEDGVPVGFGAVDHEGGSWEVAHLWVLPSHARRGIGRLLLAELAGVARGAGARGLRIEADPHAVPFYERAGARRIGTVPAPMPGHDERVLVVMELTFDD